MCSKLGQARYQMRTVDTKGNKNKVFKNFYVAEIL